MMASAVQTRKVQLKDRLDEARLESGDLAKIHLVCLRLPYPNSDVDAISGQELQHASTEEGKARVWNVILRAQSVQKISELLHDGESDIVHGRHCY